MISDRKLQEVSNLYFGKTRIELREQLGRELLKKLIPIWILSIIFIILATFFFFTQSKASNSIKRPASGTVAVKKEFILEMEDNFYPLELEIAPKEYVEEEIELLHKEVEQYLDSIILGENKNFLEVSEDLYFPSRFFKTGEEITWTTQKPWLISTNGMVHNEELKEETIVEIQAKVSYGSEYRVYKTIVNVIPKVYTKQEQAIVQVLNQLQKIEQLSRTEEYVEIPEEIFGWKLAQKEEELPKEISLILVAILLPILVYFRFFGKLQDLQKKRKEQAQSSYSEFVTKLSLLLVTGISIRQSFLRLAREYEEHYGEEHILTVELKVAKQELENGYSESIVYDGFGKRIGVLAYQRMTTLLTQNVSKGVQGIQALLLQEAKDAMAQERANIKIKGEQTGTKLLLPMMGMLVLVFAILLVPAFLSF